MSGFSAGLGSALVCAMACAVVAGMVGHGVLRPMLEARGVTPWTVRDSLGSMPLVLTGAAAIGAAGSLAAGSLAAGWLTGAPEAIIPSVQAASAAVLAIIGLLALRLGLLALRKLT